MLVILIIIDIAGRPTVTVKELDSNYASGNMSLFNIAIKHQELSLKNLLVLWSSPDVMRLWQRLTKQPSGNRI